ncbi:MAG: 16S rRNA (cytidine(1402)-2'-O)-methyltransferase [Desulfuromonadales bacterium]
MDHQERPSAGQGVLYVVATPIGNLEDITYRAVRILGEVDLVAAEDTRHSRKLFARFDLHTPLLSYHDHNEQQRHGDLLKRLQAGDRVALISDAGTPGIADPGYRLISACLEAGIPVVPVPGACALIAALSAAGLPTERFAFEGYLPQRRKARTDLLKRLAGEQRTLVFYETPHRLRDALDDLVAIFGPAHQLVVARELTKVHEEFFHSTIDAARTHFAGQPVKGEIVLLVPPGPGGPQMSAREALQKLLTEKDLSRRQAVKLVAREYGLSSSELYRESLRLTGKEDQE